MLMLNLAPDSFQWVTIGKNLTLKELMNTDHTGEKCRTALLLTLKGIKELHNISIVHRFVRPGYVKVSEAKRLRVKLSHFAYATSINYHSTKEDVSASAYIKPNSNWL
jgi:hypothetical protein